MPPAQPIIPHQKVEGPLYWWLITVEWQPQVTRDANHLLTKYWITEACICAIFWKFEHAKNNNPYNPNLRWKQELCSEPTAQTCCVVRLHMRDAGLTIRTTNLCGCPALAKITSRQNRESWSWRGVKYQSSSLSLPYPLTQMNVNLLKPTGSTRGPPSRAPPPSYSSSSARGYGDSYDTYGSSRSAGPGYEERRSAGRPERAGGRDAYPSSYGARGGGRPERGGYGGGGSRGYDRR